MEASAVLETADSYRMKVVSHHCSMLASAPAQSRTASCDGRNVAAKSLGESLESLERVELSLASFVAKQLDSASRDAGTAYGYRAHLFGLRNR